MKTVRIIFRNIRDAFKGVIRNFSLSFASISCITITLIVVAFSMVISQNVDNFTRLVEKDVTIVAFIDNDADKDEIKEIRKKINNLDNIEKNSLKTKEEITKDMRASSEVFDSIMKNWDSEENPIQNTFQVKVIDINTINETASEIKKIDGITLVKYGEGMIEQLIAAFEFIHKICIGAVIALILVTAFLISNTIKITINSRKTEIGIMRLIGASNLNIRIPFIIEGLILGLLGSIVPVFCLIYGYNAFYMETKGHLFSNFIKLIKPIPFIYTTSFLLVLIGILVGMFGSWRAVKKYLKI